VPRPIESWYTLDGEMPANLRLIRAESLETEITATIAEICEVRHPLARLNATRHDDWRTYISATNEPCIHAKYRWLFQFYDRIRFDGADTAEESPVQGAAPVGPASATKRRAEPSATKAPAASEAARLGLSHYRTGAFPAVRGWLQEPFLDVLEAVGQAQEVLDVRGSACEIGVLEGQFFLALTALLRADEAAVAIDMFAPPAPGCVGTGLASLEKFRANVDRFAPRADRVAIHQRDSLTIDAAAVDALRRSHGPARLISIDGGLSVRHTRHDLEIAEALVADGGVVFLNNYFNADWPGVHEGFARYVLAGDAPRLIPFLHAFNKLLLTTRERRDALAAAVVATLSARPEMQTKAVEMFDQPAWSVRRKPGA